MQERRRQELNKLLFSSSLLHFSCHKDKLGKFRTNGDGLKSFARAIGQVSTFVDTSTSSRLLTEVLYTAQMLGKLRI